MTLKKNFERYLSNLKPTVSGFDWFIEFEKIYENTNKFKDVLSELKTVLKSKKSTEEFRVFYNKNINALKVIPLLLATRLKVITIYDKKFITYNFSEPTNTPEQYIEFIFKTGLIKVLVSEDVDLYSYLLGVEAGINTNARKGRTGTDMEGLVEDYLIKSNFRYIRQASRKKIIDLLGTDIYENYVSVNLDNANKKFDFAVIGNSNKLYLIETNFYSSGGSKLNETSRSYIKLNDDLKKIKNIEFIWITDGVGWLTAKGNLKEAYIKIENLLSIKDLEEEALEEIIK
jgi:type II restriction enzyme